MPNTARGLPYPAATDPVAQGAAAIQALAEAVDAEVMTATMLRRLAVITNPATDTPIAWDTEDVDDLGLHATGSADLVVPSGATQRFLIVAYVTFAGASGSGGVTAKIRRYATGGALIEELATGNDGLNGAVNLTAFAVGDPTDIFRVLVQQGATGTGHNVTYARLAALRLGK